MKKLILIAAALSATVLRAAYAKENLEMNHSQHAMKHGQHQSQRKQTPKEVGDAGFAAIAEIVSMLTADPKTDAIKAKIKGLGFFGLMATGSHHQMSH